MGPHVRGVKPRVNSPELTRGSSPAEPEMAEGVGNPPPATKTAAAIIYA